MHMLKIAAVLTLITAPALAIASSDKVHLEHFRHTGLSNPVPLPNTEYIHVAQAAGWRSATVPTRADPVTWRGTQNPRILSERKGYKRLSSLVNFPAFFPGIGVVF